MYSTALRFRLVLLLSGAVSPPDRADANLVKDGQPAYLQFYRRPGKSKRALSERSSTALLTVEFQKRISRG